MGFSFQREGYTVDLIEYGMIFRVLHTTLSITQSSTLTYIDHPQSTISPPFRSDVISYLTVAPVAINRVRKTRAGIRAPGLNSKLVLLVGSWCLFRNLLDTARIFVLKLHNGIYEVSVIKHT